MIYDEKIHKFRLSNGRTFNAGANRAIGLDTGEMTVGFDTILTVDEDNNEPTLEEKIDIAEYVIAQWTAFRDSLTG